MKYDLFLSYSSQDNIIASFLFRELERQGISVWLDEKQIEVGEFILPSIQKGLTDARRFCILLSENSLQSSWVKRELAIADTLSISRGDDFVIPIRIDDCQIPEVIAMRSYIDFKKFKNIENALEKLINKVKPGGWISKQGYTGILETIEDFSDLSQKFRQCQTNNLDILLINGGATIPALVHPLINDIVNRGSNQKFYIRAVFLHSEASEIIENYQFDDGSMVKLSEEDKDIQKKCYEAIIWQTQCLQNIGMHERQLSRSIGHLREIRDTYDNVEVSIRLNSRFPSCRLLVLDNIIFYTPFLASLPYAFHSLKIDKEFPLYDRCVQHFEHLYRTGNEINIDII